MDAKNTIDSIIDLEGVYGAFFSSYDDKSIIAKMPADYPVNVMQSIVHYGEQMLEKVRGELKDCQEIRMDMGYAAVLIFVMPRGLMFVIGYERERIQKLRDVVYGICQEAVQEQRKNLLLTARIPNSQLPKKRTILGLGDHRLAPVSPEVSDSTPAKGDRYVDEEPIGEGGTAVVYRAYDKRLNRPVALKRFKDNGQPEGGGDYLSEMESVSRIQHPNVVSTYDAAVDERGRLMVMELIEGEDLQKLIEKGPLDNNRFIDMAIQALEALNATHRGGLLHLDLKPSNIMLSDADSGRGHVKLIDYGRARLFGAAMAEGEPRGAGLVGSIFYTSPEALGELSLDERADLYSLGCVFYWALSGRHPFDGESALLVMAAHLRHDVVDLAQCVPTIPKWLSDWVMWLIEDDREKRPRTVAEALRALMQYGEGVGDEKQADAARKVRA